MNILANVSPATSDLSWIPGLVQFGIAGFMLWWFTTRAERSINRMASAITENTKALMVAVLAIKHLDATGISDLARKIHSDADSRHDEMSDC